MASTTYSSLRRPEIPATVLDRASRENGADERPAKFEAFIGPDVIALRLATRYERMVKPVLDRIIALVAMILLFPVMVVIALVILWSEGRPVFYLQDRVGKVGKPFKLYKFRTMVPDRRRAPLAIDWPDRRVVHKSVDDPRVTGTGKFLRKWSLDELPQLGNVLFGHMSLVGPRPELPEIVTSKYEDWQHERHQVRPGVTGLWQITQREGDCLMHECTASDLDYIGSISFSTDLRIMLRTPLAALGRSKGQ